MGSLLSRQSHVCWICPAIDEDGYCVSKEPLRLPKALRLLKLKTVSNIRAKTFAFQLKGPFFLYHAHLFEYNQWVETKPLGNLCSSFVVKENYATNSADSSICKSNFSYCYFLLPILSLATVSLCSLLFRQHFPKNLYFLDCFEILALEAEPKPQHF